MTSADGQRDRAQDDDDLSIEELVLPAPSRRLVEPITSVEELAHGRPPWESDDGAPVCVPSSPASTSCRAASRPPPSGARSRPTPGCADALADQRRLGWIAACCLAANSRLRRFNVKDYADFASTRALELIL